MSPPDLRPTGPASGLTQLAGQGTRFWSLTETDSRVFVVGGLGTSFDGEPLANNQFAMGSAFRLGAYSAGELRGDHYYAATGGYLRQVGRLPDFMGGPVFAGAWLENGDAFNDWTDATWRTNASAGVIMDTLLGPVIVAGIARLRRPLAHVLRRRQDFPVREVRKSLRVQRGRGATRTRAQYRPAVVQRELCTPGL